VGEGKEKHVALSLVSEIASLRDDLSTAEELAEDLVFYEEDLLQAMKTDCERLQPRVRTLVRSFFAKVDGYNNYLKKFILRVYRAGLLDLSADEFAFFSEAKRRELGDGVFITINVACRVVALDCSIDRGRQPWQNFDESIKLRHRLTHPKSEGIRVSHKDGERLIDAIVWYSKLLLDLFALLHGPAFIGKVLRTSLLQALEQQPEMGDFLEDLPQGYTSAIGSRPATDRSKEPF
jgi:hypothetical protein